MGINELTFKSTINSRQIMGPLQKYTAKLSSKLEEFVPFNLVVALYSSIRPEYKTILRFILDSLLAKEDQEELWLLVEKLVLPSVLISGSCIFNGATHEKTKEDLAFGLYYDQFEKITKLLTETSTMDHNIKIVVMLEKKKKIFSGFFDILRSKQTKIVEKVRNQPQEGGYRYRSRQMSLEDFVHAMGQMGVSREEA
jgi:hypothetical protein